MKLLLKNSLVLFLIIVIFACSNSENEKSKDIREDNITKNNHTKIKLNKIGTNEYDKIIAKEKGKIVIANFYASWCPPCRQEIPGFINMFNKHKNNLTIIGLSLDKDAKSALTFINDMGINYPVYLANEELQRKFNIMSIPISAIYKPDGSLYNIHFGFLSTTQIEEIIKKLKE
ncbi:MAG: TlpA disulfide reductase family protein [Deferribacterota bacterium]|nr:TlpA disulfide reductase family protein [Deferribacterota bacterium]